MAQLLKGIVDQIVQDVLFADNSAVVRDGGGWLQSLFCLVGSFYKPVIGILVLLIGIDVVVLFQVLVVHLKHRPVRSKQPETLFALNSHAKFFFSNGHAIHPCLAKVNIRDITRARRGRGHVITIFCSLPTMTPLRFKGEQLLKLGNNVQTVAQLKDVQYTSRPTCRAHNAEESLDQIVPPQAYIGGQESVSA